MDAIVRRARVLVLAAVVATTGSLSGCVAAAAGAGAAGAIYYTNRGASSMVDADLATTFGRAQAAFRQMNITQTGESTEDGGSERELKGKSGDMDVTVQMERKSNNTTEVEVYARRNAVEWDKDYAKNLLSRIVTRK